MTNQQNFTKIPRFKAKKYRVKNLSELVAAEQRPILLNANLLYRSVIIINERDNL